MVFPNCDVILIKRTFKVIHHLLKNNGTLFTVKYLKTCRLLITRYMCGRPLHNNDNFIGTKKGFPIKFMFLKSYIDTGSLEKIKFVLTLLNVSRTIKPKVGEIIPVDLSSITNPPKKSFKTVPGSFIKEFNHQYNLDLKIHKYSINDFFINLSQGPHGPSVITISETIKYFTTKIMQPMSYLVGMDFFNKIIGPFYSFCKLHNIQMPNGKNEHPIGYHPIEFPNGFSKNTISNLSIVKDPECKMRVIAIFDYFSQFTLYPIHKQVMKLLTLLPCDRTYTQDPFHNWQGNDPFYSLDLSSATDRFPVHLQQKLLTYLYSKYENGFKSYKYAEAWKNLLVNREFNLNDKPYTYSVGQPMGALSSWAVFTLTHHLIVQYCAKKENKFPFENYIILGDDIVIKDNTIARSYIKFMTKLGVDISQQKTHVSKDTYEFAKRWIRYDGVSFKELSPIPLKGISNNINNPFIIFTIMFDYFITKGNLYLNRKSIISLVVRLYSNLELKYWEKGKLTVNLSFPPGYLRPKLEYLNLSIRFSMDLLTQDQIRNYLAYVYRIHDWYLIPVDNTILKSELLRVLGCSVVSSIEEGKSQLSKLVRRSTQYWALTFNRLDKLNLFPLFHSICNWAKSTDRLVKEMELEPDKLSFYDIYKAINFIDLNQILMWDKSFYSNQSYGGKAFSKPPSVINKSTLELINYEIKGYNFEIKSDISTFRYTLDQFLKYTTTIEQGMAKNLPDKQVEMLRNLSRRHGYAFLQ